jgi:hypothetical protein
LARFSGNAALVVSSYVAVTLLLTYPLWLDLSGSVLARDPDTDLLMWILSWDSHAFLSGIWSIFDANIYHPQRYTLAYSENLIGDAIVAAPVLWLTGNPVLALNVTSLASCVLCAAGAYFLARKTGVARPGALICGLVFAFAPARFLRIGQLHLASVHWMPFTLAFLHSYFESGRSRDVRLAIACYTLQVVSSGHGAVFTTVAVVGLVGYRLLLGEKLDVRSRLRHAGVPGALLLLPAALIFLPYLQVQREMGLRRSLEASLEWAVPASSFLASPSHVHRFLMSLFSTTDITADARAFLFPGYLPLLLAAAALAAKPRVAFPSESGAWKILAGLCEAAALVSLGLGLAIALYGPFRWRVGELVVLSARRPERIWLVFAAAVFLRWLVRGRAPFAAGERGRALGAFWTRQAVAYRRDSRIYYALLTVLGLWLSLGPPLGLWPAVYWLPGFNFIRVPARFTLMAVLGLAILAGFGFERLAKAGSPRRWLAALTAVLLVAEFAVVPLATMPYRVEIPAIDRWLDGRPKPFVVAELPLPSYGAGGAWERRQSEFMLHSMAHWQKTVHGYSGFRPPLHIELYWQLRLFPDEQSLTSLEQLGVDYIVIHTEMYPSGEWPLVEKRLQSFGERLRLQHEEAGGRVYSLIKN